MAQGSVGAWGVAKTAVDGWGIFWQGSVKVNNYFKNGRMRSFYVVVIIIEKQSKCEIIVI
jgi:hypothetical protein